jgi:GNAT superfamily N-acetyltransferase
MLPGFRDVPLGRRAAIAKVAWSANSRSSDFRPRRMNAITIRLARSDDWSTIVEFNCRLAEETEATTLRSADIEPGVRCLLDDPAKGRYFVACDGERIVGQLMHTREWSDWRNGDIWWLQSVYIHPDYRRRGVFRRLFDALVAEADGDPDVVGLRLYVEADNAAAHATYEQLGLNRAGYFVMQRLFK